jgi:hypothetical protein
MHPPLDKLFALPCADVARTSRSMPLFDLRYDKVMHYGTTGEIYNLGTATELTILDVAGDCFRFASACVESTHKVEGRV